MSAQEFKVGQSISGTDYDRLPVGAKFRRGPQYSEYEVTETGFKLGMADTRMTEADYRSARKITHLPDATEPEDKDDLYVEPEPLTEPSVDNSEDLTEPEDADGGVQALAQALIWTREYVQPKVALPAKKGWSWYDALREHAPEFLPTAEDADDVEPEPLKASQNVLVWATVVDPIGDEDGDIRLGSPTGDGADDMFYARPDAIVRPDAGQVPPWVKRARCTSLLMIDKTTNLRQCTRDGDDHDNHVAYGASWKDHEAYGRVVVSDGAS